MDIKDIKTVEQAKALAFDCLQRIEIEQQNLRAINMRITQLEDERVKSVASTEEN